MTCLSPSAAPAATRSPGGDRPGDRHLGDAGVTDQGGSDTTTTLHDVEHSVGQPGIGERLGEGERLSGVTSDGLNIIELPAASAGAAFQQAIWIG